MPRKWLSILGELKRLGEPGWQQLDAFAVETDPPLLMGIGDGLEDVIETSTGLAEHSRDVADMQCVARFLSNKEVQKTPGCILARPDPAHVVAPQISLRL